MKNEVYNAKRKKILLALALLALTSAVHAAEPIEGNWKTESAETVSAAPCGNQFCLTVQTGKHAGTQIGQLQGTGSTYTGTVTDPADTKTYAGSANVTNNTLKLKGCVLKLLCKSQTWARIPN